MATNQQLSATKQALLKIRELKQQLADAQTSSGESIAIVSMACRFPRTSRTPELFWRCLVDQTDEVTDIPNSRWDLDSFYDEDPEIPGKMYARKGVFLENIDEMDPEFFGISPREATWVDPQQRLLMEVGWEAIERAGWTPEKIADHTGVFVGWMHSDYQNEAGDSFLNLNPYIATGAAGSFLCGRLAYYLGLQGPSVAVDTACSSSLVALHLAIQSLQRRDCDRALVGGVNAIVSPTTNILTCKLQALSPNGHSRAFDAAADGYLRGEGCGVVTLRRLSDAQQAGDPILGVIRGSAVGHNGFSSGLTAPNPQAQEKVIRQALERAGVAPEDVAYLEAHGTGTELGDPIEMRAAAAALAGERTGENPLLVGSVKTNIGHLEAAAGMAGLIKVLLAIEHNKIPGQLNFENPNPHIPWDKMPVKVLTELTDWPTEKRIAGVSAFGMSGTNAHVVIEAPESIDSTTIDKSTTPHLVVLSAKNDDALHTLAEDYHRELAEKESFHLQDLAFTTSVHRSHFDRRAALVASSPAETADALKLLSRGGSNEAAFQGGNRRTPKVAWQFTGQGSQYVGMAKGLYDAHPTLRMAVDHCDQQLKQWRDESLLEILFGDTDEINNTRWTQPAIFAVQMGLSQLLQSWGLQPDVVLGHSVGQYAAACVAGIMSWDDGLRLIAERGRLIGDLPPGGKMLAIFAPLEAIQDSINAIDELSLAAINGTHIVVSGTEKAIETIESALGKRGVKSKTLTTSHAFHSVLMNPALAPFEKVADEIDFQPARIPLICNVTGKVLAADAKLSGEYWARHIREAVRFSDSVETAAEIGCEAILEIGPHAVLTRMAAANWKDSESLIATLNRDSDDAASLLKAVGKLYVHGARVDFEVMYAGEQRRFIQLPTYPFQRRKFWGPDKPRPLNADAASAHPLLGAKVSLAGVQNETRYESYIEPDSPSWLPDHEVMGNVVLPGAGFVELALNAAEGSSLANLVFEQPLRPTGRTTMQTVVQKSEEEQTLETFSLAADNKTWTRNFAAKIVAAANDRPKPIDRSAIEAKLTETATADEFYAKMAELGLNYGPNFQTIESFRYSQDEVLTRLSTQGDIRGYTIPPTLLDGAFHSLAVGLLREESDHLFLPVGVGRVHCFQAIEQSVWCHAKWNETEGKNRSADLVLFTDSGQVAAVIEQLQVQQVSVSALRQMSGAGVDRLVHELAWQNLRLPTSNTKEKIWLIVGDHSLAKSVGDELEAKSHNVVRIHLQSGAKLSANTDPQFVMDGQAIENWQSLFTALSNDESPYTPDGIVWLLGDESENADDQTQATITSLLNLAQTLLRRGQRRLECGLQLITTDAIAQLKKDTANPFQTQYWGFGRVLGAEQPEFRCRLIDTQATETANHETITALVDILLTETEDNQLVIRGGQISSPRMKRVALEKRAKDQPGLQARGDASYLITGGLGMLGRQAAKWLAAKGAGQVVLVSRRSPDEETQAFLNTVGELGCDVVVHSADLSDQTSVAEMIDRFGNKWKPLAGVIHAAGVLDDGLIDKQNWGRFERVLAPKVAGSMHLHELTKSLPLDFFILYSSAASVLGSPGQSNYATGNAFLDGLAHQRRAEGLPATSINWGPWTEGMADDERIQKQLALQGITPLAVAEAHSVMEKMLAADIVQATVMDVDWRRMKIGMGGESPAMLEGLVAGSRKSKKGDSALVGKLKKLRGAAQKELLVKTLQESLQGILDTPDPPEIDRPLIDFGLDSLMAVEFGTELQTMLGDDYSFGPTLLFDHPSIDAISDHVIELIGADSEEKPAAATTTEKETPTEKSVAREDVAIIGMSCRFPGARNIDEFWQNLLNGVDSVGDIPPGRWDVERWYSPDREPGKMYCKQGGFIDDVDQFDAAFFNISEQEACWIDPQHRLLLENSYRALEHAGIPTSPLADSNVGVFMGIMGLDYAYLPQIEKEGVLESFQGGGLSHSAGVGRISYIFGFEGPSVSVDTASSSSLVALFQAVRSLQEGDCNMALAGGVNAILAPFNSLLMSKAGLMAPDGRCKSFSAEADGFGRGEGCGVVVLKRLSDAQRDGDNILAVVRGASVVHNGFSGGITAPNSKSQVRAINEALADANIAPSQVQYLEAHGTGTEYGDPMELNAAASVYGKGRKADSPLLVGSVKANISHLEAAGGSSGLIKTILALQHGVIPPQIHCDEPSPHIPWKRLPVAMVREQTNWPEAEERFAGITSLGLVGTNAHVILSSAPTPTSTIDDSSDEVERETKLLVLSARSEHALRDTTENFYDFVSKSDENLLADMAYTAGVGRRPYEHRLAVAFDSRDELLAKLKAGASGAPLQNVSTALTNGKSHSQNGVSTGVAKTSPKIAWLFHDDATNLEPSRELYQSEPVYRSFIHELDERFSEHGVDFRLASWLTSETKDAPALPKTHLFALQAGLVQLWRNWGIEPDAALGFGVGQYTATCAAGGMCFKDAAVLVFEGQRTLAMKDPDYDAFESLADTLNFLPPNIPLICSLTGDIVPVHKALAGGYWRNHLQADPNRKAALAALAEQECDLTLHVDLPGDSLPEHSLASLRPDQPASRSLMHSLGELYVAGASPDFQAVDPSGNRRRIALPLYPFQKKRYWITEVSDYFEHDLANDEAGSR